MGRRRKVTIEQELEPGETVDTASGAVVSEAQPDTGEPPISPQDTQIQEDLQQFLSTLGVEGGSVKIYKIETTGRYTFQAECSPDVVTEDWIQSNFCKESGGKFFVRLHDAQKKYLTAKTLYIAKSSNSAPPAPAPVIVAPPGTDPIVALQIDILRQELQSSREVMLKMIENRGGEQSSVSEIAQVMTMVKGMLTPPSAAEGLKEIIAIFKSGIELGAKSGDGDNRPGWWNIVKDVASALPDVMRALPIPAMAQPNGPAPAPVQPADSPVAVIATPGVPPATTQATEGNTMSPEMARAIAQLRLGIRYLKKKCEAGKDPGIWIDVVVDNLDDPLYRPFAQFADQPYEDLAKTLDPELLQPVYRPWFETLFKGIADALRQPADTGVVAGDGDDTGKNGEPDAGSDSAQRST